MKKVNIMNEKSIYITVRDIKGVELDIFNEDATAESLVVEVKRGNYAKNDEVVAVIPLTDAELVYIDRETMREWYEDSIDDFSEDEDDQDEYIDAHLDEYYNAEAETANEGSWYTYSVLGDSAVDDVRSYLHYNYPEIYKEWLEQGE